MSAITKPANDTPANDKSADAWPRFGLFGFMLHVLLVGACLGLAREAGAGYLFNLLLVVIVLAVVEFFWVRPCRFVIGSLIPTVIATMFFAAAYLPTRYLGTSWADQQTIGHLKTMQVALRNYHDAHGSWPPIVTYDANGNPAHSWRTALLSQIDRTNLPNLYDWSTPWDSPTNRLLHDAAGLTCYGLASPLNRPIETSVLAVSVPGGYPDGRFVIVHARASGIRALEPRDITLDELAAGKLIGHYGSRQTYVAWPDGPIELAPISTLAARIEVYVKEKRKQHARKARVPTPRGN